VNWETFYTDFTLPVRVITPAKTKEQEDVQNVHHNLCRSEYNFRVVDPSC